MRAHTRIQTAPSAHSQTQHTQSTPPPPPRSKCTNSPIWKPFSVNSAKAKKYSDAQDRKEEEDI